MAYKISGTKSETARIMILKESDWSIESNTVISGSGAYEVDGLETGTKTTLARTEEGELLAFGNVTPIEAFTEVAWLGTGWPHGSDQMEVTIGSRWKDATVPFAEDDVIRLTRAPDTASTANYSEDGTLTANNSTNRLLFSVKGAYPGVFVEMHVECVTTGGNNFAKANRIKSYNAWPYNFAQAFDANHSFTNNPYPAYMDVAGGYYIAPPMQYNGEVFKTMTFIAAP
jgi:hypothetical protein